jgi:enoyl-CoA hydratase/carnithine racemase
MTKTDFDIFFPKYSHNNQCITLNFSHGRANEMGTSELKGIEALCHQLESGQYRVLISTSQRLSRSGKSIFISGANVTERSDWTDSQVKDHVVYQRSVLNRLKNAPVFHIVVVDGIALGWGTEYLLTADYRLCTQGSTFGLPETGLGILPGAGGSSDLWSHIGYANALRLGMAGERINGAEAQRINLVQECFVDWSEAMERAEKLSDSAVTTSPTASAAFKTAVLNSMGAESTKRNDIEAQAYEHCVNTGEAGIGRKNFKKIISGVEVEWGPYRDFRLN